MAYGKDFTLDTQAAYGSDFDFDAGGGVGVAAVNFENRVYAVGTATVDIENVVLGASVGVATVNIENQVYGVDTATVSFENGVYAVGTATVDLENSLYSVGTASVNFENIIYLLGTATAGFVNKVYGLDTASVDIENVIARAGVGTATVSFQNEVYGVDTATVNIRNHLNDYNAAATWQVEVLLGGVDMTARLQGDINVDAIEGAAKLAEFTLSPFSGAIDPYDWIGASVMIDFVQYNLSGVQVSRDRLFTGIVEEPTYSPTTRLTSFLCTDGLQEYLEQQSKASIDSLLGGYHSTDVFGETDNLWDYAQQRMSTQPASFDLDVYGNTRKTDWQPKATADLTFNVGDVINDTLGLSLISRRDVLNTINISFAYRYGRKWQRELSGSWNYPRPFYQYLSEQTTLPNKSMILSALDAGWEVKSINWQKLPASGQYTNSEGALTTWGISDSLRESLVWGVRFSVAKRWLQDITETYGMTVTAPASVNKHGELKSDLSYALDVEVDEDYEQQPEQQTIGIVSQTDDTETGRSFGYKEPEFGGTLVNNYDTVLDPDSRADFDTASQAAIAEAKTQILSSHRSNVVVIDSLIVPQANTSQTAQVNTTEVTAKGKVRRVNHVISIDNGSAQTSIEIAVYQPNVAGQVDDVIAPPSTVNSSPNVQTQGLSLSSHFGGRTTTKYNPDWTGYIGNWVIRTFPSEWYPEEFRVDFPAVEDDARNTADFNATATYNIAIPQDTLTINA